MNTNPSAPRTAAGARRQTLLHCAVLGGALLVQLNATQAVDFPRRFLDADDSALLAAPRVDFQSMLRRIGLLKPLPDSPPVSPAESDPVLPPDNLHAFDPAAFTGVGPVPEIPSASTADETTDAELSDLRAALKQDKQFSAPERDALVARHQAERLRLATLVPNGGTWYDALGRGERAARLAKKPIVVHAGLPDEFADYFRGAIAWRHANTNAAVAEWERLLARPPAERRYKTTWATYMLGRALAASAPDRAAEHFRRLRELPKAGFADSLHLAASATGWEAKVHYEQHNYYAAAMLYLESGRERGDVDELSLRWVAGRAIHQGNDLDRFARHPVLRRVLTAWVISFRGWSIGDPGVTPAAVARWLDAVETTGVREPDFIEELALASVRIADFERARRWLKVAPVTPLTRWLQAKLLLHDGKLDQSAAVLREVVAAYPLQFAPAGLEHSLSWNVTAGRRSSSEQVRGELATLRTAQRQYFAALDGFLEANQWEDAAYLAERVLTLDELKMYVDARSPDLAVSGETNREKELEPTMQSLRWLLARRLTREHRGHEAKVYFPSLGHDGDYLETALAKLLPELRVAWDEQQPSERRATAFIAAGRLLKLHGMQLIGTELAPDYFVNGGSLLWSLTVESRLNTTRPVENEDTVRNPRPIRRAGPTAEEMRRAAIEPADPPQRFHYRYIAADLLWRAAELMPNNSDAKASALCEAGTWIKYDHPQAADRYYKALVRQCGKTEIGRMADDLRWFPLLDVDGQLLPEQPRSRAERRLRDQEASAVELLQHEPR